MVAVAEAIILQNLVSSLPFAYEERHQELRRQPASVVVLDILWIWITIFAFKQRFPLSKILESINLLPVSHHLRTRGFELTSRSTVEQCIDTLRHILRLSIKSAFLILPKSAQRIEPFIPHCAFRDLRCLKNFVK